MVVGFVPNWARDVAGFSVSQLGYLSVMYLLPNTVMARLSGAYLAPRFGFRKVLAAGFAIVAAACFLYPRATAFWGLLAVQGLFGVGMGLILPLTLSAAIRNIPDHRRGAAIKEDEKCGDKKQGKQEKRRKQANQRIRRKILGVAQGT